MSGKKSIGIMPGENAPSRDGYGTMPRARGKASSRGVRRKIVSVFTRLARIQDERPSMGPSQILKPLPIGDWQVAAAERRVAIFNGNKGE
jgi:hypothetical protein